jgi:hypothetical protein
MAFVSPLFLTFIATVFRPILSLLLPLPPSDLQAAELGARITARWADNISSVPLVVVRLLKDGLGGPLTLSKAFFELALTPETARVYALVEFYQTLPPQLVRLLRSLLTVDGEASILGELVRLAVTGKHESVPVLSFRERDACPSLFQRIVLSQFDFDTFAAVMSQRQPAQQSGFAAVAYIKTGEREKESIYNRLESMMHGQHDPKAAIRHPLHAADPIPLFTALVVLLNVQDFFKDFLVRRGPRQTYFLRANCAEGLEEKCDGSPLGSPLG